MIRGGKGGGNTLTGLNFEKTSDINVLLDKTPGYSVKGNTILYKGKEVAKSYKKHGKFIFNQHI